MLIDTIYNLQTELTEQANIRDEVRIIIRSLIICSSSENVDFRSQEGNHDLKAGLNPTIKTLQTKMK